jgi:Zn-dependent protease
MTPLDPIFIRNGLITFILLVASLAVHEWGHAIVADALGDDTPRMDGRVTLNPLVHMDLLGTVFLPLFNIFALGSSFPFIAWAKPVRVNLSNFRHRARDDVLATLAGPATNLAIGIVAIVVGSFLVVAYPRTGELVRRIVMMNVGLAVFNMVPIPPLDGGVLIRHAVGMSEETFIKFSRFSGIAMLIAINISAVQQAIGTLVALAIIPYWLLCGWINPSALSLIFP